MISLWVVVSGLSVIGHSFTRSKDTKNGVYRLWAARFFKTRSIARDAVNSGKVQYNGQRAKPGKNVELEAHILIPQGYDQKLVKVLGLSEKRLSAPLAQQLYEETAESIEKRQENIAARKANAFHSPRPEQKPDKKQRRELIKLKSN